MSDNKGLMAGKRGLIMGVANNRSIAWGIAEAMHREGAELAFTYANEKLKERVAPLAAAVGSDIVLPLDVTSDAEIDAAFAKSGAGGAFKLEQPYLCADGGNASKLGPVCAGLAIYTQRQCIGYSAIPIAGCGW